jgi:hypothetical protein
VSCATAIFTEELRVPDDLFYPAQVFLDDYLADMIFGMAILRPAAVLNVIIHSFPPFYNI